MSEKLFTGRIKQYCSNGYIILDDDKGIIDPESLSKIMTQINPAKTIEEQIKQISIPANHGNVGAMFYLAKLYEQQNDTDNKIKYLKMASDNDFTEATIILVNCYKSCRNYEEIAKYDEILFRKGHVELADELGVIYEHLKMYPQMIKYYDIAIKNKSQNALRSMILHYSRNEYMNIDKLLEYFLLAVELKDPASTYALAIYYDGLDDSESAQKYFKLALDFGDERAREKIKSDTSEFTSQTNQPTWSTNSNKTTNTRCKNYFVSHEKEDTLCNCACVIL